MKKYITEFLGTFFLVLTVGLTGNPLAIGSILMAMVYMGGHVSGAHYNPAVSLAIVIRGKMDWAEFLKYAVFQILGALLASFIFYAFMDHTFFPAPGASVSSGKALLAEFLFTFALASVVLHVATTKASQGMSYYGIAIGFTVLAAATAVGSISGGAFNPAVAIGPILADTFMGGNSMGNLWIYLVGCFAGGAFAGILFKMMHPEE